MTEDQFDWHQFDGEQPELPDASMANILSQEMLAKRLVWDAVPCDQAEAVSRILGLPPTSPDVDEMEHRAAHERLRQAAPVMPYVQALLPSLSRAIVAAILHANDAADDLSEEDREEMSERLAPSLYMGVYTILAELINFNILHLPHRGGPIIAYVSTGGSE